MQQVATYEAVARVCEDLQAAGQKVTGDAVLLVTGGSKGTVLEHVRAWRRRGQADGPAIAREIPADFQGALFRLLGQVETQATESLKRAIAAAEVGETEALTACQKAEGRVEELTAELDRLRVDAEADRQRAETAAAVACQEVHDLRTRVDSLEVERRQLIEAGEGARTEAAKAQLQVERADRAAAKADEAVTVLEARNRELLAGVATAEQGRAVAEQRARDLGERIAAMENQQARAAATLAKVEEECLGLRAELAQARAETAAADKRASLAEQRLEILQASTVKEAPAVKGKRKTTK